MVLVVVAKGFALLAVLNSDDVEIIVIQGLVVGLVVVEDLFDVKIVVVVSLELVKDVIVVDWVIVELVGLADIKIVVEMVEDSVGIKMVVILSLVVIDLVVGEVEVKMAIEEAKLLIFLDTLVLIEINVVVVFEFKLLKLVCEELK